MVIKYNAWDLSQSAKSLAPNCILQECGCLTKRKGKTAATPSMVLQKVALK